MAVDSAHARADDIAQHFAARQRELPALWNGRVLLLHRFTVENGVLHGASFETDYASFLAWRDWGCPDAGVHNVFAAAALQAADGADPGRPHGAVHVHCGPMAFSVRHARSGRHQRRDARPCRQRAP